LITPENLSKESCRLYKFRMTIAGPDKKVKELLQQVYGVKYLEVQGTGKDDEFSYIVEADKDVDVRKPISTNWPRQDILFLS